MIRALTKNHAIKSIKITPERHRLLRKLAADQDLNLIEIADKVIEAGVKAVQSDRSSPSAN